MCSPKLHALAKKSLRLEEWHVKQNTSFLKLQMWAKWRLEHVEWHGPVLNCTDTVIDKILCKACRMARETEYMHS